MIAIALVFGIVWGTVASHIATRKRRDGVAWFCAGFFFGIFGVLAAALVSTVPDPFAGYDDGPVQLGPSPG